MLAGSGAAVVVVGAASGGWSRLAEVVEVGRFVGVSGEVPVGVPVQAASTSTLLTTTPAVPRTLIPRVSQANGRSAKPVPPLGANP